MKKIIIILAILFGCYNFVFCLTPSGSIQLLLLSGSKVSSGSRVIYFGNGNSGGTVPVDPASYMPGSAVTTLGNTGNLVKTDFVFTGWNTEADESGIAYPVGAVFSMGSHDVALHAIWRKNFTNSRGMTFHLIPAGTFKMGSPAGEPGRNAGNETQHDVTLTQPFYMQTTEVTQGQWQAVIGSLPPEIASNTYGQGSTYPIYYVTWYDSAIFCNQLSTSEGKTPVYYSDNAFTTVLTGTPRVTTGTVYSKYDYNGYRLPTEAQWEYTCRAGSSTAFANGGITYTEFSPLDPNLDAIGWYGGNNGINGTAAYTSKTVAQKQANAWGVYDMHGNMFEFCSDWYLGDNGSTAVIDPTGTNVTTFGKILRGGIWFSEAKYCRSAYRDPLPISDYGYYSGFRVVLPLNSPPTTYQVFYNPNGNTGGTVPVDPTNYAPGSTAQALGNTGNLVRTGFFFNGWNSLASGSGVAYPVGSSFTINNNMVLFADWLEALTFTFNNQTGQRLRAYIDGIFVGYLEIGQTRIFGNNPPGTHVLKADNFGSGVWTTTVSASSTWLIN